MPFARRVRLVVVLGVLTCWAAAGLCAAHAVAQFPGANGRIAFDSDRGGDFDVYTMAPDGTDVRRVTTAPGRDTGPAFSPDGTRIAFVSHRDGDDEIYVMDADGSDQTRLTHDPGVDLGPAFSPDGTRIAFSSDRAGSQDVYTMALDGSDVRHVVGGAGTQETGPAYAPDGTTIAFTSNAANGDADVWTWPIVPRPGVVPYATRLTTTRAADAAPSYSPDGRRIVFSSARDLNGHSELYEMDADGRHQRRLTRNDWDDETPSFSPDGDAVVSGGDDVRVLGFRPGRETFPGRSGATDEHPSWQSVPRPPACPDTVLPVPIAPLTLDGVRVRGTELRYRLSAAATVRLTMTRLATGRRVGPLALPGDPGWSFFTVRRRLAHRTLAPGRYRLTLTARLSCGPSVTRTARVTVR